MDECTPLEPFLYPINVTAIDVTEVPVAVVNDEQKDEEKDETIDAKRGEKKVRSVSQYSDDGQVPLGFVALGMIVFVLVVGFLSN